MLNDGSAVVFYNIFSSIFLFELDIGLGQEYTVGGGFVSHHLLYYCVLFC